MAKHLSGKVARVISDLLTIGKLIRLIEHEMEKRIVARHALVKLDTLLQLCSRLKNEIRSCLVTQDKKNVDALEEFLARLRRDLDKSHLTVGRDAFSAHALQLDLKQIIETWQFMSQITFGVLEYDVIEIDNELRSLSKLYPTILSYRGAAAGNIDTNWRVFWRMNENLGDPSRFRVVNIYPGLATAGIVAPIPGGDPAQDATIRAAGLATFLRQVRIMLQAVERGTEVERLFAEMMVNDYFSLWELLFSSNIPNEHGQIDHCVLQHWQQNNFAGAACLAQLNQDINPHFERWRREVRNRVTAHVDADADLCAADLNNWPMTIDALINECLRIIERLRTCAMADIRSKPFFILPTSLEPNVIGLSGQDGRRWNDG